MLGQMLRGCVIAVAAAVCATVAGADEPTAEEYQEAVERHDLQSRQVWLDRYFGGAEIIRPRDFDELRRYSIRPNLRPDNVARHLERVGASDLPSSAGAEVGAAQCRFMIYGHGATMVVTAVFLGEQANIDVLRSFRLAAHFVVTGVERDLYAAVCADAHFSEANIADVNRRPNWLVERFDTEGHKVLLTTSPVTGPIAEAVRAMLENVLIQAPRIEMQSIYFPDLAFSSSRSFDPDSGADTGPLLDEERVGDDDFVRNWYTRAFVSLGQPSLYARRVGQGVATYRMTRLPSFSGPSSMTVTLDTQGRAHLIFRSIGRSGPSCLEEAEAQGLIRFSNDADMTCGPLTVDRRDLGRADSRTLIAWFERRAFWEGVTNDDVIGLDGCQMLTEGLVNGRYHVVDRWRCSAGEPPEIRALLCRSGALPPDPVPHGDWPPLCETP